MAVNIFLLDRRTVTLAVAAREQVVGTLRRFFKLTELDDACMTKLDAAARITPSPVAVLLADVSERPLADAPAQPVAAHLVLG